MEDICDIEREILLKLPPKSLLRFTVVCKSWYNVITNSAFISAHVPQTPHSDTLLVRRYDRNLHREHYSLFQDSKNRPFSLNLRSELHFPFNFQGGYFSIVGSCNGILCLSDDLAGWFRNFVLWNPSIQKFIFLPLPLINPQSSYTCTVGFGAASSETDNCTLVRLVYPRDDVFDLNGPPEIEIYSMNSGVWRRIMGVHMKHFALEFSWPQGFVNGVVHGIGLDMLPSGEVIRKFVMTFNIAEEMFGEITLPDALVGVISTELLIVFFQESLAVVKYEREERVDASCELWVMKQYGVVESWSRLYRINLVPGMEEVVGFRINGEVLFSHRNNNLVSYDPNSGQNRDLGIQGSIPSFFVQNYRESLLLLNGNSVFSDRVWERVGDDWVSSLLRR